ncbi:MAG: 50S ribosomal protein L25 [Phycisphaerae bacterium]|nr:50S ribosomal protein L25 [Phycisphaerae bacterium]
MSSETMILKAEKRDELGTKAARRQRANGLVPVVIYGHKKAPQSILLNYHDLAMEIQHHHRLLDVDIDGTVEKLLIKDIQYDYLGDTIVHLDLTRVNIDERVTVTVSVELKGIPAGTNEGGVLEQTLTEVELECLAFSIPESIKANVKEMAIGDALKAGDLVLPSGATLITDPENRIATVKVIVEKEEDSELGEGEEGTSAEPELIGGRDEGDDDDSK